MSAWLIALALDSAGIAALRAATRAKPGPRPWLIVAGWIALLFSAWPWTMFAAGDRGVPIGFCVVMGLAFAFVLGSIVVRKAKARAAGDNLDPAARPSKVWRAVWRFLAAGPLAGVAAYALAAVIGLHAGGTPPTRSMIAAYLLPVLWGAAMTWAMADERLVRATLGLAALIAACAGVLATGSL